MLGCELLVALAQGQRLGGLHETAGAVGVFLEIHVVFPRPVPPPLRRVRSIVNGLPSAVTDLGQMSAEDRSARTPNGDPHEICGNAEFAAEEASAIFACHLGNARLAG